MPNKFVIKKSLYSEEENEQIVISLRAPTKLLNSYDELSGKSAYSRNKLICMAMQYALDNIDLID